MSSPRMVLERPPQTAERQPRSTSTASGEKRDAWIKRNWYYHRELQRICHQFVPPGSRILLLGSQTGNVLSALQPDAARSIAIDASQELVDYARHKYPQYRFECAEPDELVAALGDEAPFDYIVMPDLVGLLDDLQRTFAGLHPYCHPGTRVVLTSYNFLWEPVLALGEKIAMKIPQPDQNWLSMNDVSSILRLSEFEVETTGAALLIPRRIPFGDAINRFASRNGLLHHLCLIQYHVAAYRPPDQERLERRRKLSVSVVVPCRNEAGNIEDAVRRIPEMGSHTEILFIDGQSTDGTVEKIEELAAAAGRDVKLMHQVPRAPDGTAGEQPHRMLKLGKGDAVRKAFAAANGEILMILDADLTVPPEDLPKFFYPLADGSIEFANGCRLVYPMQDEAMRFVNLVGNRFFGVAFSWLLGQPVKDTLCGTKAIFKKDYEAIAANRAYFGEFDPFGDFDLLFGAARLRMRIGDVPIRYRRRVAGQSKVSVLRHGVLLARMTLVGFYRLKLLAWIGRATPPKGRSGGRGGI